MWKAIVLWLVKAIGREVVAEVLEREKGKAAK